MPIVVNNGAPITFPTQAKGGKRPTIPGGMSEQPMELLSHPLCRALMDNRTPIMEPKGDAPKGEMIQRKGYRLEVDGYTPASKKAKMAEARKEAAAQRAAAQARAAEDAAIQQEINEEGDGDASDQIDDLKAMSRGELNEKAAELGIEGAGDLPNRKAVTEAILLAQG